MSRTMSSESMPGYQTIQEGLDGLRMDYTRSYDAT